MRSMKIGGLSCCMLLAGLNAAPIAAQNYPTKPIRIITGDVGGTADVIARIVAQAMTPGLGQQVIVDNRGGASGAVATQAVSRAAPDGYTLLFYASALWLAPLMGNVPWDPVKDFAPVSLAASAPNVLVVHPSLPVKSVKELIALAKAKPGALNYGSGGAGGSPHLAGELFKSMAKVDIVRIAYKGTGPAVNDLLGGHVQLMFASAGALTSYVKSGRLRALAVTSLKPSALAPGLPPLAATVPGFVTVGYYPLFAPAATPASLIHRLQQEVAQVVHKPEVKERLINAGVEPVGGSPEELAALIKSEMVMWGKLFKEAGIHD
jgi:tripartite-type tricarboxylate transporter receptor subunit TctC